MSGWALAGAGGMLARSQSPIKAAEELQASL